MFVGMLVFFPEEVSKFPAPIKGFSYLSFFRDPDNSKERKRKKGTIFISLYNFHPLCIPLRGNIPLVENNLFAACYRHVGRKKLLKTINL